jgi:hypothetical protein
MAAPNPARRIECGHVLLEVELQERVAVRRVAPEFGAKVFEEHDALGQDAPVVRAQVQGAEGRRVGGADGAGAGRLLLERQVVEDGHAAAAVDDEIDLHARARAHAFEDAGAGEHRVIGPAPRAVPFEPGAVAVAFEVERIAHQERQTRRSSR